MKIVSKILSVMLITLYLTSNANAINLPTGKTINQTAVLQSIEGYNKTIIANPNAIDAYINRAYLYYLLNDIESAIKDYDKIIQLNPKNEEFYLNRGYLKHISNSRKSAISDYQMALKINPRYALAYNNIGVALAELGESDSSLNAYNMAIKLDPNYADAYYNRGNLETRKEKNEEALEDFNRAIQLNPTDSASFNNRGVVKRKLNYNVGALSDFTIAVKLNPEDITAYANRGRLKKRYFDSEGAEEDFKNAIALAEDSPVLIKEIELEKLLASNNTSSTKKVDDASSDLNKVLSQPKITQEPIQKIAQKQFIKEDNKTETPLKTATVKTGMVKMTQNNTVNTVLEKANAQTVITTKPVSNPKLAECYYIRGLQKYILQNRESALADFNMAIQYNPSYAEAYYYRAAIKRDMQDNSFVDDYKQAVSINPSLKSVNDADVLTILKM
jgi:tetratricopeptide (TPR) repeat protein